MVYDTSRQQYMMFIPHTKTSRYIYQILYMMFIPHTKTSRYIYQILYLMFIPHTKTSRYIYQILYLMFIPKLIPKQTGTSMDNRFIYSLWYSTRRCANKQIHLSDPFIKLPAKLTATYLMEPWSNYAPPLLLTTCT